LGGREVGLVGQGASASSTRACGPGLQTHLAGGGVEPSDVGEG
jgi:hypothetical protein